MSLSAIDLCARALIKIGATPPAAFTEPTAEAEVARNLYAPVRDALLSAHPWSFATAQTRLPRLAEPPLSDFAFAYQLPPGFLRALSAGSGGSTRGVIYRIVGAHLHSDAEEVMLSYIYRPADGAFPPYFDWLLIAQLAAEFCLPLTESTSRAQMLTHFADLELRRARNTDSQAAGLPPAFEDFTLIGARR
jgi:hypothetical protein